MDNENREATAVDETLSAYPGVTEVGFLIGLAMRRLQGQGNPAEVGRLIKVRLSADDDRYEARREEPIVTDAIGAALDLAASIGDLPTCDTRDDGADFSGGGSSGDF